MEATEKKRLPPSGFATLRDAITFVAGMVVIGYEVFFSTEVDVMVLAVGLTLSGLPIAFGADERRRGGGDGPSPSQ